jgi:voltage-dependent calcium channel L type alpha-1D
MKKTRSLFLFGHDNPAREIALHTCTSPWFDAFIMFVIVGNAVMMALDDPLDSSRDSCPRDPCPDDARSTLELLCNLIFTAELLVKVFSYGFVIGEGTYLRSGWNILDFIIGACSLKRHPLRAAPALRSMRRNRR